jgi:hypothetical protein
LKLPLSSLDTSTVKLNSVKETSIDDTVTLDAASLTQVGDGHLEEVIPVVGITLPFMSAGGSSNLCIYIAMGVVFSVYRVNCDTTPVDFRMVSVRTPYR